MAVGRPIRYGRYEILGPLATGGMADLDLARASGPSGFESLVVVKRIRAHLADNPEFVRLFLSEARLAAQLRHPNLVTVFDAGEEHGEYFYAMELVHGRDARALLDAALARSRPLSYDEALSIVIGVCAGLHHAHQRTGEDGRPLGIVHRDISPSNVLISFDGAVKLADFGIAKATERVHEPGTNTLRGKLTYMSPEQSLGRPIDRRSDLYGLAVVLYELTTGSRPYPRAASEFLEVKQAIETPPVPPSQLRPDYPPELEQIVLRGLARDPEARYPTAQELQLELEELARRRQLAISSVTLAQLMEALFPHDLDAWQLAKAHGASLAQHLTSSHTHSVVPSPAPLPARRWLLPTTAAVAAAGLIAWIVAVWPQAPRPLSSSASRPPAQMVPSAPPPPAPPPASQPLAIVPPHAPAPPRTSRLRPARRERHPVRRARSWDPEAPLLPR